ncbi:hypothetical protein [Nocardioides mesophilus]|uniref:Uncharacterized protein n=1 Tax=Nocardioides mesophilus TaxID=433659 RepID=A0A7G9RCA8_9ACTN|nr:hypothetical protein [Nocardioides mesophilus]QNN53233.1 hypothetical protein H9L09_01730 [Nocardioides mesophilus]
MTSNIRTQPIPAELTVLARPSRKRRAALVVAGAITCALPLVFTLNITRMLATGVLPDHRFHQLTGQGEILFALWLWPIIALLRAGWQGRCPGTWAGYLHLAVITAGIACAAAAPGGGAPFLVAVIAITGALLWAVLPQRPQLRATVQVDPLLAPVALVSSALLLRYAVDQVALQNAATTGHHAHNPHFFDQAWIAVALTCIALLAALVPAARSLARWVAGSLVTLGVAGLALGESTPLFAAFLGLGVAAGLAHLVVRRRPAASGAC